LHLALPLGLIINYRFTLG